MPVRAGWQLQRCIGALDEETHVRKCVKVLGMLRQDDGAREWKIEIRNWENREAAFPVRVSNFDFPISIFHSISPREIHPVEQFPPVKPSLQQFD